MNEATPQPDWRTFLPPIFAACVAEESGRYAIDRPFIVGEFVYATNGAILVRGPKSLVTGELPPFPEGFRVPHVEDPGLGWYAEFLPDPLPIASLPDPLPDCECKPCNGTGLAECDMGHEHDCPECGGVGSYKINRAVEFDGATLNEKYLRPLLASNARVHARADGGRGPVRFFIDGGIEGLLMPCKVVPEVGSVNLRASATTGGAA